MWFCGADEALLWVRFFGVCRFAKCTFFLHAHCQTFLEAAKRAPLPLWEVHGTPLLLWAGVLLVVLDRTLEEALRSTDRQCKTAIFFCCQLGDHSNGQKKPTDTEIALVTIAHLRLYYSWWFYLAAFTSEQPIVIPRHFVSAHRAAFLHSWSLVLVYLWFLSWKEKHGIVQQFTFEVHSTLDMVAKCYITAASDKQTLIRMSWSICLPIFFRFSLFYILYFNNKMLEVLLAISALALTLRPPQCNEPRGCRMFDLAAKL